jgi:KUP system potassium uptake protein
MQSAEPSPEDVKTEGHAPRGKLLALALGSVGVVYGDIGTSPLYAMRESLKVVAADGVSRAEVTGVVSLLLWSLILVLTIKYVVFLLRADNKGEGGILSLLTLVRGPGARRFGGLTLLAIVGASLFLGDAVITPAISVLSAVEGLKLIHPGFERYILPVAAAILIGLFAVQSRGTEAVARWFGPITAIWFLAMAVAGVTHILDDPGILFALNPLNAVRFIAGNAGLAFVVLGAVFLAVTGAEALYADLGHFGRKPIQLAWLGLIFPALSLNYLGQGAMVLHEPEKLENSFYLMFPDWALIPMVILATMATVIASQAVISGAYSLTRQAIQLGFLPRMVIRHTSEEQTGQIFMPAVTGMLLAGVLLLVAIFRDSSALAAAYGISVSATMVVESILFFFLIRGRWHWSLPLALMLIVPILIMETGFFLSNMTKFFQGGYMPVLIGLAVTVTMWTWIRGTAIFAEKTRKSDLPLTTFIGMVERESEHAPVRVPGTAMFMTSDITLTPSALLHNLKHNHVLHEQNVVLAVKSSDLPMVDPADRMVINQLSERFWGVEFTFGYMETPNVSKALPLCRKAGLKFDIMSTSFYLGRRKLVRDPKSALPGPLNRLFIAMARGAVDPTDFFHLPANRVVEMGAHVSV